MERGGWAGEGQTAGHQASPHGGDCLIDGDAHSVMAANWLATLAAGILNCLGRGLGALAQAGSLGAAG